MTLLPVLLLVACGDKIPTPWSKTEGRQEVVVDPKTGEASTVSTSAGSEQQPAAVQDQPAAAAGDELDCDTSYPSPEAGTLGSIECGATIMGSTAVGSTRWGDEFYQRAFCTPRRSGYDDAPEVLYKLELPANVTAEIELDSPCTDLDVVSVAWQLDGVPELQHVGRIAECEMDAHSGGGKITLTTVDKAQVFLVGVDGKNGDEGNFQLSVECGTFR